MSVPKNYAAEAAELDAAIRDYEGRHGVLKGLQSDSERESLVRQIIDSRARVRYTDTLISRDVDPLAADPRDPGFHPLKAAVLHARRGDIDEAAWMVFLYVHFGMHARAGWWYVQRTYGACDAAPSDWWTWKRIAEDPTSFRFWLDDHQADYAAIVGGHGFGNHRKYASLKAWTEQGTGAVVESYVDWVLAARGDHEAKFSSLAGSTPQETFDNAYKSVGEVRQFGRVARFDYVTMLGRLQLIAATPPHTYLVNATGPLAGARLLMAGDKQADLTARQLEQRLAEFSLETGVAPDVLEDAVCNWQKSPARYLRFSA